MKHEEMDISQIFAGTPVEVLDHGFTRVVDIMGNESSIVAAVKMHRKKEMVGFDEASETIAEMIATGYTAPFEMCVLKLHIKAPLFIARQFMRHRMSSVNEYSCTKHDAPVDIYAPEQERIHTINGNADETPTAAGAVLQRQYANMMESVRNVTSQVLEYGKQHEIDRNLNRCNMTVAHYTEFYWQVNLRTLLDFLKTRLNTSAEMHSYASAIANIVQAWVPTAFNIWLEDVLYAETFSLREQEIMAPFIKALYGQVASMRNPDKNFRPLEWKRFLHKLESIAELHHAKTSTDTPADISQEQAAEA